MDWLLNNLQIVIGIIVIVVWILRSVTGANQSDAEGQRPAQNGPAEDPGEADRTRQIQEEIRRRILARQRGETAGPPPLPPVMVEERTTESEYPDFDDEGPNVPMPTAAARRQADEAQAAILDQQHRLVDQLHALRASRVTGAVVAPVAKVALPYGATARIAAHGRSCRRELIRDLHTTSSLRRAILLKEILGAPLALQRGTQIPRR